MNPWQGKLQSPSKLALATGAIITALTVWPVGAEGLRKDKSWDKLSSKGRSLVIGRFEGAFQGPHFSDRKVELVRAQDRKKLLSIHRRRPG